MIGGNSGQTTGGSNQISDIELIKAKHGNDNCDPTNHLPYPVAGHSSIASDRGVITCGGSKFDSFFNTWTETPECYLVKKDGETRTLPTMKTPRINFGLGINNDILYAVGGTFAYNTMEMINMNTDSGWSQIDLPFGLDEHCVTTTQTTMVITGGVSGVINANPFSPPPKVSKIRNCE